jgi:hypothetical protein
VAVVALEVLLEALVVQVGVAMEMAALLENKMEL